MSSFEQDFGLTERLEGVRGADHVVLISGVGYDPSRRRRNAVLAVETSPGSMAELEQCLFCLRPGEPQMWMEIPSVSFVFLQHRSVVAEWGVSHRLELAMPPCGYRELQFPERLLGWLRAHGITGSGKTIEDGLESS